MSFLRCFDIEGMLFGSLLVGDRTSAFATIPVEELLAALLASEESTV